MSPWYSDSHSIDTDRHIKMFLTQLSRLDSEMKGDKSEKPVWITSWTYLCLLNVKRNMQQHGSLRNYYGGKPLGEGIVRKVKPLMSRFTPSWETVTTEKYYQHKTMHRLSSQKANNNTEDFSDGEDSSVSAPKNFVFYSSIHKVKKKMKNQQPVSGFLTHHDEYIIMIDGGRCCKIIPDKFMSQIVGMNYFSWEFQKKNTMKFTEDLIPKHFILFLPLLQEKNKLKNPNFIHTIITTEYETIRRDKSIGFPLYPKAKYSS